MTSIVFKKALLVASAQVQYSRPPAALAFMSGMCDRLGLAHDVLDINTEILKRYQHHVWFQMHNHIETDWAEWPADLRAMGETLLDDLVDHVADQQPDMIALTVLSHMQHVWAQQFLRRVRQKLPNTVVIAGGPGVAVAAWQDTSKRGILFGRWMVEQDLLDYFVLGEGEVVFDAFLHGATDLPGLNGKHKCEDTWQPQLDDLNIYPWPSYKKIPLDHYRSPEGSTRIIVSGSRGCVRTCTFCDVQYHWPKYRYRNGVDVANEILQHHRDTGATNFWFNDSLINGSLKNFREMLRLLRDHRENTPTLADLSISGQFIIRPRNSHPESFFKEMGDAGISRLDVGVESGSAAVRDHMNKKFSNQDIDWHLEMSEKYNIKNWFLMIVGYPTETQQDFEMTLDMMRRYQKYIINDTVMGMNLVNTLLLLPNSPVWQMSEELEISHDTLNYYKWISRKNPTLTLMERTRRWIVAAETAMEMGYPLPVEIMYNLEKQYELSLEQAEELNNPTQETKPQRRIIPIATEVYN